MDCCNYPEYRAQYAWECAGGYAPHAPLQYAYAPGYYAPHAHEPYARYYHCDYRAHHHNDRSILDHALPMDYGAYASKEARARRSLGRRDARTRPSLPAHHLPLPLPLPLPHTPPLECGLGGLGARGSAYCEPQMWPSYQMGMASVGAWGGGGAAWGARTPNQLRRTPDFRPLKAPQTVQNQMCLPEGRSTPAAFPLYEETAFGQGSGGMRAGAGAGGVIDPQGGERARDHIAPRAEPRPEPPEERRAPATVPLPAFQQAFGSTEIGRFAEAFSRAEAALEEAAATADSFAFDAFSEWEAPSAEQPWSPPQSRSAVPPREIKCEDMY